MCSVYLPLLVAYIDDLSTIPNLIPMKIPTSTNLRTPMRITMRRVQTKKGCHESEDL